MLQIGRRAGRNARAQLAQTPIHRGVLQKSRVSDRENGSRLQPAATGQKHEIHRLRVRPTAPPPRPPAGRASAPDRPHSRALLRCALAVDAGAQLPRTAWPRWPDREPSRPIRAATLPRCAEIVRRARPRAGTLRPTPPAGRAAGTCSFRRRCSRDDRAPAPGSPRSAAVGTGPAFRSEIVRPRRGWQRVRRYNPRPSRVVSMVRGKALSTVSRRNTGGFRRVMRATSSGKYRLARFR